MLIIYPAGSVTQNIINIKGSAMGKVETTGQVTKLE
jgi:hypothetical protein